jgi:hypothetical protein
MRYLVAFNIIIEALGFNKYSYVPVENIGVNMSVVAFLWAKKRRLHEDTSLLASRRECIAEIVGKVALIESVFILCWMKKPKARLERRDRMGDRAFDCLARTHPEFPVVHGSYP